MPETKILHSLGKFLRQERERRGLTVDQVASATKINIRQIHLLEADQYAELPAKPFVRGFVISYARYLGLDTKEILIRFSSYLESKAQERPTRDQGHTGYAFDNREGSQSRTFLWAIMVGFMVLGGALVFVLKPSFKTHRALPIEKLKEKFKKPPTKISVALPVPVLSPAPVVLPSPLVLPSPAVLPSSVVLPPPLSRPDPLNSGADLLATEVQDKVLFKALEDVWVRYKVDDKKVMKFPLRKGRILVLRSKHKIIFQVSNPKTLSFNLNNKGHKILADEKLTNMRQTSFTFLIPVELLEITQDPFPGEPALPPMPPPKWNKALPQPVPS
jgi:cytoskeleton protein RodZ